MGNLPQKRKRAKKMTFIGAPYNFVVARCKCKKVIAGTHYELNTVDCDRNRCGFVVASILGRPWVRPVVFGSTRMPA